MKKLNSHSLVPPGGFKFKDPVTGHEMQRYVWEYLLDDVANHRRANNLPPISTEEIEDQMCNRMGKASATMCNDPRPSVDGVSLTLGDIMRGTAVIASFKLAGSPLVSQEEAERRAVICAPCLYNVNYRKPCSGVCAELVELVATIVGGAGTSRDGELSACGICRCSNMAQVWIPVEFLKKGVTDEQIEQFPAQCWKKQGILEQIV